MENDECFGTPGGSWIDSTRPLSDILRDSAWLCGRGCHIHDIFNMSDILSKYLPAFPRLQKNSDWPKYYSRRRQWHLDKYYVPSCLSQCSSLSKPVALTDQLRPCTWMLSRTQMPSNACCQGREYLATRVLPQVIPCDCVTETEMPFCIN